MPQLNCAFLFQKKINNNLITLVKEVNWAVFSGEDYYHRLYGLSIEIKFSMPYLKPQRQVRNYLVTFMTTTFRCFRSVKSVRSQILQIWISYSKTHL